MLVGLAVSVFILVLGTGLLLLATELELPVFLLVRLIVLVSGLPNTGFALPDKLGVLLSAALVATIGSVLLYKALRRVASPGIATGTVLVILLGTNLLDYATNDASYSHVYSFALIAALVFLIPRWYESGMRWSTTLWLGAIIGMITLVRGTNVLLVLLWGIRSPGQAGERLRSLGRRWVRVLAAVGVAVALFLPQLGYWRYVTGSWITDPYPPGWTFDFLHPHLLEVLFSVDHGLFVWAPVLLVGLLGLVVAWIRRDDWALALTVFLPLFVWVVASWPDWTYAWDFGHRGFVDVLALFALPIALALQVARGGLRTVLATLLALFAVVNLWLGREYWNGVIPPGGITLERYGTMWRDILAQFGDGGAALGLLMFLGLVALGLAPIAYAAWVSPPAPRRRQPMSA